MDLFCEIMVKLLQNQEVTVSFPNLNIDAPTIVEQESYVALQKIKAIIENGSFSDFECIEEIVCVFESMGSGGGNRHDFG